MKHPGDIEDELPIPDPEEMRVKRPSSDTTQEPPDPFEREPFGAPEPGMEPMGDIEFSEDPLCRFYLQRVSEPCWGPVMENLCNGHRWVQFNGRYYSEADAIKARKTGGRLLPTFVPLAKAPLPDVDPELSTLWYIRGDGDRAAAINRATWEAELLQAVDDAYNRRGGSTKNRPQSSVISRPVREVSNGMCISTDGGTVVPLEGHKGGK